MIDTFNTGETPAELRKNYNPEGSLLRAFQERLLEMLQYIHKVCQENNIDYRLQAGNVLGAVRHGGFIPWDDDVDIVVSLKDLKKIKKILLDNPHPQYKLQCKETDPYFFNFWIVLRDTKSEYIQESDIHKRRKYRGAQIDIFAFEPSCLPLFRSITSRISKEVDLKVAPRSLLLANMCHSFQKNVLHPVFRLVGRFLGDKNMYCHSYGVGFGYYIPKDVLLPHKDLQYEHLMLRGPAKPEEFCRLRYGEKYLELPPKESRNKHQADYKIWK